MIDSGIEFDNLHFHIEEVDAYNKPFNFVWSEREPGKTTSVVVQKIYNWYKKYGYPSIALRHIAADITDLYAQSFEETINKFKGREVHLIVRKEQSGIMMLYDVPAGSKSWKDGKLFLVILPLGAPMNRLKSVNVGPVGCIMYDEAIINKQMGEKYPSCLPMRFNEIYRTFARECRPRTLKVYCLANPYSKYHPLLVDWGVPINEIKRGHILTGPNWLVYPYQMKPELREYIMKNDPTAVLSNDYTRYAFDGEAVNDTEIPIRETKPEGYKLHYVFKVGGRFLYLWKNANDWYAGPMAAWWAETRSEGPGKRQEVISADFQELVRGSVLIDAYKGVFDALALCVATQRIEYQTPEAYFLIQEIYSCF